MISDLAETVSLDAGRVPWQKVEVDSASICAGWWTRPDSGATPPGAAGPAAARPAGHTRPARFERAVLNLLSNALKYSPGKRR